jgi:carbon monoxide dehydrogenase subunit G
MLILTSKTGKANARQEVVYNYITDFRNFASLLPADRLENIEITIDSVKFSLPGMGLIGLKIAEQHPFQQLIVDAMEGTAADFTFRININPDTETSSQVNVELNANLNMFLEMMAKSPLQQFLDLMMDKLELIRFDQPGTGREGTVV